MTVAVCCKQQKTVKQLPISSESFHEFVDRMTIAIKKTHRMKRKKHRRTPWLNFTFSLVVLSAGFLTHFTYALEHNGSK
jgi:hypothetical protein